MFVPINPPTPPHPTPPLLFCFFRFWLVDHGKGGMHLYRLMIVFCLMFRLQLLCLLLLLNSRIYVMIYISVINDLLNCWSMIFMHLWYYILCLYAISMSYVISGVCMLHHIYVGFALQVCDICHTRIWSVTIFNWNNVTNFIQWFWP